MKITKIVLTRVANSASPRLKAYARIVIDDAIMLHGLKVIEGKVRLFVAMPTVTERSGKRKDIFHPVTQKARALIETTVLDEYYLKEAQDQEVTV